MIMSDRLSLLRIAFRIQLYYITESQFNNLQQSDTHLLSFYFNYWILQNNIICIQINIQ